MPRAKRTSDDAYNTRRRLKRQAAREAKAGNTQLAENLTRLANATYAQNIAGKRTYSSATLANLENIRKYQRARDISAFEDVSRETLPRRRRNSNASREERRKLQRQERKQAAEERKALEAALDALRQNDWQANIPRRLSGWQRQALFASTAHLWQGKTYSQREQSIMQALGVGSLEEAFAKMTKDINADQLANASAEEKYALTTAFSRLR